MKPVVLLLVSFGWFASFACSSEETHCYRGEYHACTCDGARSGLAQCLEDESAVGACDCSGAIPGLAGGNSDAGTDAAPSGKFSFMQGCERDDECETGLCYPFKDKGPHCSKPCANDGECPLPSPGCNNKGICKAP